jgi:sugar O-acyltransferase (sialic acid O-acetyltransferase NeuD family)
MAPVRPHDLAMNAGRADAAPQGGTARQVVLFGIGSPLVVEYVETCRRLGWRIAAGVKNRDGEVHLDAPGLVLTAHDVTAEVLGHPCLCPMFTPANRAMAAREAKALGFDFSAALIDPHAVASATSEVGGGSFINAGCLIGAMTAIGRHVVLNRGASVGHHVRIGACASVGPGAIVAGLVEIGVGAMVGAGAVLLPKVKVGAFAVVGAGAIVTRDIPERTKVLGNPARVVAGASASFDLPDGAASSP